MTTAEPSEADSPPPGDLPAIPDVTLLQEIARGGMGIVYRGRQDFLERDVAVKLLSPQLQGERFTARFRREARLLASIKHPHIVACHAAGVAPSGQHYLVMELVRGPTLAQWIVDHGPVPAASAVRLVGQLAEALGHACELGVIHRDVKTANILLETATGAEIDPELPFQPKLVDLGLARLIVGSDDLASTAPGALMGTPATMAPEQFDAPEAVDFRADIYGLGCVLYEMLAGAPAYASQRLTELVLAKRRPRGPDPCERASGVPAALGQLVAAMLANDPGERPADYRTLRELLAAALSEPAAVSEPAVEAAAPAGPNLLQTAEFEFLAAGRSALLEGAGGGGAFTSRAIEPVAAASPSPPKPAAPPVRPRVIGARASVEVPARRPRRWLAAAVVAPMLVLAAVPLLRRETPPVPASGDVAEVTAPPPASTRPAIELVGLDGDVPRGEALPLQAHSEPVPTDLRCQWTVVPAGAAVFSAPGAAVTTLRHSLLPGDEFTVALAAFTAGERTAVERRVLVHYAARNLFADFFAPDSAWMPPPRQRIAWRPRDGGGVVATAGDLPLLRTRGLTGSVWRVAGSLVPENAEGRGGRAFAEAAVCLRLGPQRQLAILCTRDGADGGHWVASLQLVGREEGRPGPLLRPLKGKARTAVEASGAKAATFVLTRRGDEVRLEFGFAGGGSCTHVDFVPREVLDVPLSLFTRGGRAVFAELSHW